MNQEKIHVPLDVPPDKREAYIANYHQATHGTGRLMLMAGDPVEALKEAVQTAGCTQLICAGGEETSAEEFLTRQWR
jgi:hypothetical protein